MSVPVLTFFNNKGGVGKTSLVYHVAWMLARQGVRVVAVDLDPQANLTAAFLSEEEMEDLWQRGEAGAPTTIYRAIEPLTKVGDLRAAELVRPFPELALVPGDLALSGFEDQLSGEWPNALGSGSLYRPFRVLTSFWQVAQLAAEEHRAALIVADVGPNLGAINRSALIASDHVAVPLAADLFSLQGLRNLGPTLRGWRKDWQKRLDNWSQPGFALPKGAMDPIGYLVQQHSVRLDRPVKAYDRWAQRIPEEYRESVLGQRPGKAPQHPSQDPHCLGTLKHYRSLVPLAQEARKPIFELTAADGALGAHATAVQLARKDFSALARTIRRRLSI